MIHHAALEVREDDADADVAFWGLLGFAEVGPSPALARRARWLQRAGTQIHLLFTEEPLSAAEGHVAVIAPAFEETLAALRGAGHAPEPRTEHWGAPRAFVRTPSGHRVELMAFPPDSALE